MGQGEVGMFGEEDGSKIGRLRVALLRENDVGELRPVAMVLPICRFFNPEFVREAIDDIEKLCLRQAMGEPVTALEKMGIELLLQSAYIDIKRDGSERDIG